MDSLHGFDNLLTTISRYQALEKLYSMRLAQFGLNRLQVGVGQRSKSVHEAMRRTREFVESIGTRGQQCHNDLDESHCDVSLIKPICEFIDEQLMKKPENETDIMVMSSISNISMSFLQSELEPMIKGDEALMTRPIVSLTPEEQGQGTVVIDGATVGPIDIPADSLRVMDATRRVNNMAAAMVENYLKENSEQVKQDPFCLVQLNDLKLDV